MNVNTIEWHKENLKNQLNYLSRQISERNRLEVAIKRLEFESDMLRRQILQAEKEGRNSFDPDRHRVARKKCNPGGES